MTKDTVCLDFEGSVSSVPTGGTGPYRYQWFLADASDTGMTASDLLGTKDDAIQDFTTWCRFPGQALLGVTVTDANNCTRNDTTSVLFKSCFDLAIRKRVTQPNQAYYSGDLVSFDIEIFNQGDVDAIDVEVSDILDQNMQYDLADNTSVITGNDHDWSVGLDGNIVTVLDRLDAGERKVIKVFLRIKENISSTFLINFAEIIHATSVVSSSDGEKFKKDPEWIRIILNLKMKKRAMRKMMKYVMKTKTTLARSAMMQTSRMMRIKSILRWSVFASVGNKSLRSSVPQKKPMHQDSAWMRHYMQM